MAGSWIIPLAIVGVMLAISVCVFVFSLIMKANKPDGNPEHNVGARDTWSGP
jgi:flagellar basal body-associated protein FliL